MTKNALVMTKILIEMVMAHLNIAFHAVKKIWREFISRVGTSDGGISLECGY